ncbi:CTP synthase [Metamycoplasma hyosynoviae]|uniref:CTP synthase n=1 Tax=Metamycoplasma hyosynoviae TaxID=29559 RepID=UPI00235952A5|nr:CTP synthase [Metamycoplasma hyosynoviae]MDC8917395.1 CTP synthase [Metamycoplasma hyosynoviae]
MKTKYIFVTGGVVSGLGKGVCAASVGNLLKNCGYNIFSMKLDPYLNTIPGLLSPIEHGEVYITNDGTETDLDLGYYERFIGRNLTCDSSITSGKIYQKLYQKETSDSFDGKTLQVIPSFTNEIQEIILSIEQKYKPDFAIIEIGGTVGDLESNPFFYTIAQLSYLYPKNILVIHNSYLPFLEMTKDYKTKPTQHSISTLRSLGINPGMVFLRSHKAIKKTIAQKLSKILFIDAKNIINIPDFDNIYKIPLFLENKKILDVIAKYFNLKKMVPKLDKWKAFVEKLEQKKDITLNIAMCGKFASFIDSYKSVKEALEINAAYLNVKINLNWIDLMSTTQQQVKEKLDVAHGILLLPSNKNDTWDLELFIAEHAISNNIPILGIDRGMLAITYNQIAKQNSNIISKEIYKTEMEKEKEVIDIKVKNFNENEFSLRIGERKINVISNTKAHKIYGENQISERHKHKYCILYENVKKYENQEFKVSGLSENKNIVEIVENPSHKFCIGVQFLPQFQVKPLDCGKLFKEFLLASKGDKK